jgi:hypothetical protein
MGKETKELKMDELEMINQNNDAAISDADLDKVAGGFFAALFANIRSKASSTGTTGGSSGGGMNDPAQQFQQILQQLTQG